MIPIIVMMITLITITRPTTRLQKNDYNIDDNENVIGVVIMITVAIDNDNNEHNSKDTKEL